MAISFETDIKPLFTDADQACMLSQSGFDLHKYSDVKSWAPDIAKKVKAGKMPPPSTGRKWSPDKVQKFQDWIDAGYPV
jgi:hypothetical protein